MEAQLDATWLLYQCATVTPEAFSPGPPPPNAPKPKKNATTVARPMKPIQRFKPESFIVVPSLFSAGSWTEQRQPPVPPSRRLALLRPLNGGALGRACGRWLVPTRVGGYHYLAARRIPHSGHPSR